MPIGRVCRYGSVRDGKRAGGLREALAAWFSDEQVAALGSGGTLAQIGVFTAFRAPSEWGEETPFLDGDFLSLGPR